ncbi:hypothetical protein [Gordonia caeni]|uniref:Uncharacterized protein n=1 Tax=Gordonia caeni TaxID=1007097 RepID=A0ABP7NZM0_9ACTN
MLTADEDPGLFERLHRVGEGRLAGRAEASVVIDVEAFDWNCGRSLVPQTPPTKSANGPLPTATRSPT